MHPSWKRNLWVIWVAEFTSIVGFTIVVPFLPFYVQELGITDPDAVKLWAGLVLSAHAITMAVMGPIWGTVADRYGRKLMVVRAMFAGAAVIGLTALVESVQQLVLLRVLQGALTGTVVAATTLVASSVPRERSGSALGMLQMAIYSGASVGPLVGGLIADAFGFRAAFWTTSGLLSAGGLLVVFLVREDFQPPAHSPERGWKALRGSIGAVVASRPLLGALGVRLVMRSAERLMGPVLPLFVQDMAPASRVATLSGTVQGASAAAAAIGAVLLGRIGDRVGHRRVLVACALSSSVLYVGQSLVTSVGQLTLLRAGSGLAMGGTLASLTATLAGLAPEGRQGAVYGVDAAVVSLANGLAPMMGTSVAVAAGLRAPFLCAAVCFALGALVTARLVPRRESVR